MAIELVNIMQINDGRHQVTIQDTADQTGLDEKNAPVYRTYTLIHPDGETADRLKKRFENLIKAEQVEKAWLL